MIISSTRISQLKLILISGPLSLRLFFLISNSTLMSVKSVGLLYI
ncbi:unnamed protein product, partial [Tenebrio molitor]